MRIAVVTTAQRGGLLHYAVQLADALAGAGHEVDLIAPRRHELAGRLRRAVSREVLPELADGAVTSGRGAAAARRLRLGVRLARTTTGTVRQLRRGRYDVAILTDDPDVAFTAASALLVVLAARVTVAAVCHEPRPRNRRDPRELYLRRGLLHVLLQQYYQRLSTVFVHGERSRRAFLETWPPVPVAVIPHGNEAIFAEQPPPPSEEECVLFFGEWRRAKGLPELMAAFDGLAAARPRARLLLAGRPSPDGQPERIRQWAAAAGNRVQLVDGYVPAEQVPQLFARARVVVTPYVAAAQSGVVHLAMTMARAVVASDVGDLPDAVTHGRTGLLVPPGDVDALREALERLLGDAELADRLGLEARQRAQTDFGWHRVADEVTAALARTTTARSGRL